MEFDSKEALVENGFIGFKTISELRQSECGEVYQKRGIYLVVLPDLMTPRFLPVSTGGRYRNDPTVEVEKLSTRWVTGTRVLYIGKVGKLDDERVSSGTPERTLRKRLWEYIRFGRGDKVVHHGGRYIWQLANSDDLQVCWKHIPDEEPKVVERRLIAEFKKVYRKHPFANIDA
jgi:hypothetical protein